MEFKVSVYPLNFFLVNKTFKTNNTSFRGEKMKVLLTQSEEEKLFEGCEDFGKTYTKISDRSFQ